MLRAAYNLATRLAEPLLRRKLAKRALAEPGYGQLVEERFGHYAINRPDADPLIWIHAVSLGETRAAALLLGALRERMPGMRLLLTNGTATGRAEGEKLMRVGDAQVWQPWDSRSAVARFLDHFRPSVGILMETEIWPNLLLESASRSIPLVLANARLSEKSLRGAQRGAWLMQPAYSALSEAWAQTQDDATRLRTMGVPVVEVMGNLKFDARPDPALLQRGHAWREHSSKPVVMLASSRDAEEAQLLELISTSSGALEAGAGTIQWLIVPRHPQRFDEVEALIRAKGLSVGRRTGWGTGGPPKADVWLGDSLGEMPAYYALSDVALLGGSFEPLGGQNLIEAAACRCPMLMGPHTFNFEEAARLAEQVGAARRVPDLAGALQTSIQLLQAPEQLATMRQAGHDFAVQHGGAAARMADALMRLLATTDA